MARPAAPPGERFDQAQSPASPAAPAQRLAGVIGAGASPIRGSQPCLEPLSCEPPGCVEDAASAGKAPALMAAAAVSDAADGGDHRGGAAVSGSAALDRADGGQWRGGVRRQRAESPPSAGGDGANSDGEVPPPRKRQQGEWEVEW